MPKVAILGGGIGALSAALALTDPRNPNRVQYDDITIFQMGWRLGGKGASGRSHRPEEHHRTEEHGLHGWFGFYENAFRTYKDVIREYEKHWPPAPLYPATGNAADWPEHPPFRTWRDAFFPRSSGAFIEFHNKEWHKWPVTFPEPIDGEPGSGSRLSKLQCLKRAIKYILANYLVPQKNLEDPQDPIKIPDDIREKTRELLGRELPEEATLEEIYRLSEELADRIGEDDQQESFLDILLLGLEGALWFLQRLLEELWRLVSQAQDVEPMRENWVYAHYIFAHIKGIINDDLLSRGFDFINDEDYREWLGRHAIDDGHLMLYSPVVEAVFLSSFAYEDGDMSMGPDDPYPPKARFEAGTALRGLFLGMLNYKEAFGWKMAAGTGETVFSPIYTVLKGRGVKFKFFHKITEINCNDQDQTHPITSFSVAIQAKTKPEVGEYRPLIRVKDMPCWPSQPLFEQLVQGDALRASGHDLESPCSEWKDVDSRIFSVGPEGEFQYVLLGISLGALPMICKPLLAQSEAWRDMVKHVKTTRTQSLQLWLNEDSDALGWKHSKDGIVSFYYGDPDRAGAWKSDLGTWSDMTHTHEHETWPDDANATKKVKHIGYFCSAMPGATSPPSNDPVADCKQTDPAAAKAEVRQASIDFLNEHIHRVIWANASQQTAATKTGFRWNTLVDHSTTPRSGEALIDSQYYRANVYPSDLYVLSVPGSTKHRLAPHNKDEFPNLYLAGDWTRNGLNCGAMETAVMGGLLAAHALSGFPAYEQIIDFDF